MQKVGHLLFMFHVVFTLSLVLRLVDYFLKIYCLYFVFFPFKGNFDGDMRQRTIEAVLSMWMLCLPQLDRSFRIQPRNDPRLGRCWILFSIEIYEAIVAFSVLTNALQLISLISIFCTYVCIENLNIALHTSCMTIVSTVMRANKWMYSDRLPIVRSN